MKNMTKAYSSVQEMLLDQVNSRIGAGGMWSLGINGKTRNGDTVFSVGHSVELLCCNTVNKNEAS